MSAIFISYRREDSEDSARALYESLLPQFGRERIFMDVEAIALGSDFRRAIEGSLASCGVFLAIIGPTWLNITAPNDSSGKRRLDNPEDPVRQEIAAALKKSATLPVIPVLIRGASMPTADQLPDDLKDLAYRNALSLSHLDWDANVQKLVATIQPKIGGAAPVVQAPETASVEFSSAFRSSDLNKLKKTLAIGIAALVIVGAAAAFYFTRAPKPVGALTVTLVKNPRLTNQPSPVDVSIDDHPSGQIRFDSSGSSPFQFQAAEGEHQIKIANPQTNASCSGTFSVNPKQTKFLLRMRDNGTACALDPAL